MPTDPRLLIPKDKCDIATAKAAVAAGFPAVEPILPQLLEWIQDVNWPVAHVLLPFFRTIGRPLIPEVRRIFATDDDVWKYWVLTNLVDYWPPDLIAEVRTDLERFDRNPTPGETKEEVALEAREVLKKLP